MNEWGFTTLPAMEPGGTMLAIKSISVTGEVKTATSPGPDLQGSRKKSNSAPDISAAKRLMSAQGT
jgi:hypothetical protein